MQESEEQVKKLSTESSNRDFYRSTQRCLCKLCGRHIYAGDSAEAFDKEICNECSPINLWDNIPVKGII